MHLGGGVGLDAGFGRKLRGHKVTADELPDYVERVVRRFVDGRDAGERFAQWVARADEEDSASDARLRAAVPFYCPFCGEEDLRPHEDTHGGLALPVLPPCLRPQCSVWLPRARRYAGPPEPMPTDGSDVADRRRAPRGAGPRAAWRARGRVQPDGSCAGRRDTFGDRFAITSSMADAVLIDMVAGTGRRRHRRAVPRHRLPLRRDASPCATRSPRPTAVGQDSSRSAGADGAPSRTPPRAGRLSRATPTAAASCARSGPLDRALAPYDAWGSGLRRDDSIARSSTPGRRLGPPQRQGQGQPAGPVDRRAEVDDIHRPARDPGQPAAVGRLSPRSAASRAPGARGGAATDARSGRWAGRGKTECGIHVVDTVMSAPTTRLSLDVAGRRAVVVGGGPVAARRAAGAGRGRRRRRGRRAVRVRGRCATCVAGGRRRGRPRDYAAGDLDGAWLVHTATGDRRPTTWSPRTPRARGCGACAPTTPALSAAWTPAVARSRRVTVAVTAGGDPRRARRCATPSPCALDTGALPLRRHRAGAPAHVALVGGGPGDPGLITTRGRRLLAEADVVVVDRLAPRALLDELDPEVVVVDVGKTAGHHPRAAGGDQPAARRARRRPGAGWCGSRAATRSCSAAAARRRWPASPPASRSRSCPG